MQVEVELVDDPDHLEGFVLGYGAPIRVRQGTEQRSVWLVASATDFAELGQEGREVDPELWHEFSRHASTWIHGIGGIHALPRILRVAEFRALMA